MNTPPPLKGMHPPLTPPVKGGESELRERAGVRGDVKSGDLSMNHPSSKSDDKIDRHDALRTALIVSGLFWGLLLYGANFDASLHEKLHRVLGDAPNGLKFELYILFFTFQLSVPMIYFLYHTFITRTYAKEYKGTVLHVGDVGAFVGLIGYLKYLVTDTGEGPQIRRSKRITFAGILYLIGIVGWWIYWTDKHGM